MELVPIREHLHENEQFIRHPECNKNLGDCIDFYKKVGYNPPWVCYYVRLGDDLVGAAAFKGRPANNKVEIAYGTFPMFQNQGIGAQIAHILVRTALETDPGIIVTARTLPEENYSVRLLRKNNFKFMGVVHDDDDGDVWEWEYRRESESPHKSESKAG